MADDANFWAELLGDDGSDDEEFEGFTVQELAESEVRRIMKDEETARRIRELENSEISDSSSDEDDESTTDPTIGAYDYEWLKSFEKVSGPIDVLSIAEEYEIFRSFFDEEVIGILVTETNRYYAQMIASKGGIDNLPPSSNFRKWKNIDSEEMKAFLAVIIFMGLVRLRSYEMYWNTDPLINLEGFRMIMSRNKFNNILAFLHAADNSEENAPAYHKIEKISQLLLSNWQRYYYPGREVSVDETLVPFKGRTKYLQYIPSKPHKWGLKVWTLADSKSSYVWNWELYTGKVRNRPQPAATVQPPAPHPDNQPPSPPPNPLQQPDHVPPPTCAGDANIPDKGVGFNIVYRLIAPLFDQGHHLYCDNFFTSPSLFQALAEKQTGACGTLRKDRRGVPAAVKRASPKKGDPPVVNKDGVLTYITWQDRRLVRVLTTVHNGSTYQKTVRSKFHEGHTRQVDHPKAIQLYTKYMGGVDVSDQQMSYCMSLHRSLKWWKKLFLCNLLEVSLANAKVIWKELNPRAGNHLKTDRFRLAVIHGLLEGHTREAGVLRKPVLDPPARLLDRHFPGLNPKKTPGGRRSNPDCKVCSDRAVKRCQTQWVCLDCRLPMCPHPCFARYHTYLDYKIKCYQGLHQQ